MATTVMTPIGVLYFPALFTPRGNRDNPAQAPRFSTVLMFDELGVQSSAYQDMRQAVMEAITEKFGAAKAADAGFVRSLRLPFRQCAEKTYAGFEEGHVYISAWAKGDGAAPGVVDLMGTPLVVPGDVYGGQLARLTVRAFAYDSNGNKGVSFGLEHVQIVKADMPRRDGQQSAEQAFKGAPTDDAQMRALGITVPSGATGGPAPAASNDLPF